MRMIRRVGILLAFALLSGSVGSAEAVTGLDGRWYPDVQRATVRWTQQALKTAGIYGGPANGTLDPRTMEAIRAFQTQKKMHPSGVPTPLTRRALREAAPSVKAPPEPAFGGVATVSGTKGEVRVTHAAPPPRRVPQEFQHRLRMSDVVETGPNGKAVLHLDDGSALVLGNNTRVQVKDFLAAPAARERNVLIEATKGVLRFVVRAISDGADDVWVQTPTAYAAVRGTDWMISVSPNSTGVFVENGSVIVQNVGGSVKEVVLNKGQGTEVEAGKQPTDPAAWAPERIRDLFKAIEFP